MLPSSQLSVRWDGCFQPGGEVTSGTVSSDPPHMFLDLTETSPSAFRASWQLNVGVEQDRCETVAPGL